MFESLILIPPFVLRLLQTDSGRFTRSLHHRGTTDNDRVFVVGKCIGGQKLSAKYGNSVWLQRSVYEWFEKINGSLHVVPFWSKLLIKRP